MAKLLQKEILKCDLQLKATIQDIKSCNDSINVCEELYQVARSQFSSMKNAIDQLESVALEQLKTIDSQLLNDEVDRHRKQLAANQAELRKTFMESKKRLEDSARNTLLGASGQEIRHRGGQKLQRDMVLRNSTNATDSLLRISRMMAEQVQSSTSTLNTLQDTSATLQETQEEVSGMSNVIKTSGKLLTKYGRRELTDRVLIVLAMLFFFACVLYVIKKRFPIQFSIF